MPTAAELLLKLYFVITAAWAGDNLSEGLRGQADEALVRDSIAAQGGTLSGIEAKKYLEAAAFNFSGASFKKVNSENGRLEIRFFGELRDLEINTCDPKVFKNFEQFLFCSVVGQNFVYTISGEKSYKIFNLTILKSNSESQTNSLPDGVGEAGLKIFQSARKITEIARLDKNSIEASHESSSFIRAKLASVYIQMADLDRAFKSPVLIEQIMQVYNNDFGEVEEKCFLSEKKFFDLTAKDISTEVCDDLIYDFYKKISSICPKVGAQVCDEHVLSLSYFGKGYPVFHGRVMDFPPDIAIEALEILELINSYKSNRNLTQETSIQVARLKEQALRVKACLDPIITNFEELTKASPRDIWQGLGGEEDSQPIPIDTGVVQRPSELVIESVKTPEDIILVQVLDCVRSN